MLAFRMRAAGGVELLLHQMAGEMDDVHLAAVVQQAARRLEPEQAAADHGRASALLRRRDDARAVVERAKAEHAGLELAVGAVHALRSAG